MFPPIDIQHVQCLCRWLILLATTSNCGHDVTTYKTGYCVHRKYILHSMAIWQCQIKRTEYESGTCYTQASKHTRHRQVAREKNHSKEKKMTWCESRREISMCPLCGGGCVDLGLEQGKMIEIFFYCNPLCNRFRVLEGQRTWNYSCGMFLQCVVKGL